MILETLADLDSDAGGDDEEDQGEEEEDGEPVGGGPVVPGLGVDPHLAHGGRGRGGAGHRGVAQHRGRTHSLGGGGGAVLGVVVIMVVVMVVVVVVIVAVPLQIHGPADLDAHGGPVHLSGVGRLHGDVADLFSGPEPGPVVGHEADPGGEEGADVSSFQGLHGVPGHEDVLLMIVVNTDELGLILKTPFNESLSKFIEKNCSTCLWLAFVQSENGPLWIL